MKSKVSVCLNLLADGHFRIYFFIKAHRLQDLTLGLLLGKAS
jgi:hypothetical protein